MLAINRKWFDRPIIKGCSLYELPDYIPRNKIVQVRVNNIVIPIRVKRMDKKNYLDISLYFEKVKDQAEGTITVFINEK